MTDSTTTDNGAEALRLLVSCQIERATEREPATYPAREDGVDSIGHALAAAQVHALLDLADAIRYVGREVSRG